MTLSVISLRIVATGAALAGLMGAAVGRRLSLEQADLAAVGPSRLYISGPRITDLPARLRARETP